MTSNALRRIPLEQLMDLKVDFSFKQIFGKEKNKDITIVFLNAILQKTGHQPIIDVSFENIEIGGETEEDKQSRLDILVTTQDQKMMNIEIQFNNRYDMKKRTVYYWSRLFSQRLKRSEAHAELQPVIMINILNFDIFQKETGAFHTTFHLYEDNQKFKLTDVIEIHFIEMTKLIQAWYDKLLDPWNNVLARWLLLLGTVDRRSNKIYEDIYKELEEIAMKDPVLRQAFQSWQELSSTKEQMLQYESRLKHLLDEEAAVREAQLREEAALERGLAQGLEQGIEQGIYKEKIETARNLILNGMDSTFIQKITQLSFETIEQIRADVSK